ncbi:zinc ribbon domain-containing protein [Microcystis sp.]|uniref:zinc ribbon domain-containing protein n=1 Tax=Microcystis sp. TaxID=1127 RepID=UPI003AF4449D
MNRSNLKLALKGARLSKSEGILAHFEVIRSLRLCYHLDDLIFRSTKVKAKTCKCHHNTCNRLRLRIRNLVDELHHKVARFLVENFDGILLPTFEVSEMVLRSGRKIKSKSVRQMLTWSHYRFKMFLKSKAFEYGKPVIDCCEAYTSKTVSWNGELIDNLGGKKVIKSEIGGQQMDRYLNGSGGFFLLALVDTPSFKDSLSVHC